MGAEDPAAAVIGDRVLQREGDEIGRGLELAGGDAAALEIAGEARPEVLVSPSSYPVVLNAGIDDGDIPDKVNPSCGVTFSLAGG